MDWTTAYSMRPEFAVGDTPEDAYRLFEGRLKSTRTIVGGKDQRATDELQLLQQDRAVIPKPPTDYKGLPRWDASRAKELMYHDVMKEHKHTYMSSEEFYLSRPEYYNNYSQAYIIGKIDQMLSTEKFTKQIRKAKRYGGDGDE